MGYSRYLYEVCAVGLIYPYQLIRIPARLSRLACHRVVLREPRYVHFLRSLEAMYLSYIHRLLHSSKPSSSCSRSVILFSRNEGPEFYFMHFGQTLPTYTFLSNAGITPSSTKTFTLSQLTSALKAQSVSIALQFLSFGKVPIGL